MATRNVPGQGVGAKACFDFFTEGLAEELNYNFSAECPCLERIETGIILIHVDDLIFTGCSKYINEIFLPKNQDGFDTSVSKIEKIGDDIQRYGSSQVTTSSRWLKAFEKQIGKTNFQ